ncbi:MAG TPA: hypothetical protein VK893_01440, partial [Pyrinomonadaceae bacterium]|nr:hypothetical protein [Pyrinomonadaceae bacterium]
YDELSFPLRNESNEYLPRLWATRRVGWLMEQVRSNGEQKELRDEIIDLGTRYGIVTPYTSYLALEPENQRMISSANPAAPAPGLFGAGAGSGGLRRARASATPGANAAPPQSVAADTGLIAVQESKRMREQQEVAKLKDETRTDAVRRIGGKTFYLIDDVWTDSEFKEDANLPETKMTFGSEEYFGLMNKNPKLANYLALGERVVVVFEGRVYRISAATP